MTKKRRVYTAEFRQEALSLLERSGKGTYEIEQDLGITHGLLYKWQRRYSAKTDNPSENVSTSVKELEAEIRRLKRENAILQEERAILKHIMRSELRFTVARVVSTSRRPLILKWELSSPGF